MKNTRKITLGAMLIAIAGALIIIDRITNYFFSTFIVLAIPVVVIVYSLMYTIKDGVVFSIALLIVSIFLGMSEPTLLYVVFVPVGVIAGLLYALGVKKDLNKKMLMFISMAIYILGEIISTFLLLPLVGISVSGQLAEMKQMVDQSFSLMGGYTEVLNIDFEKILLLSFFLGTLIVGIVEGLILHLLSSFMLHKLKIAEIKSGSIIDIKPNRALAYICITFLFGMFFIKYINNETILYTVLALSVVAFLILAFYGYIFVILYSRVVIKRNIIFLIILAIFLFLPLMLLLLVILGFLYCSGPLYIYLLKRGMKAWNHKRQ